MARIIDWLEMLLIDSFVDIFLWFTSFITKLLQSNHNMLLLLHLFSDLIWSCVLLIVFCVIASCLPVSYPSTSGVTMEMENHSLFHNLACYHSWPY